MNRLQANLCLLCVTLCWSAEVVLYACIPDSVPAFAMRRVTAANATIVYSVEILFSIAWGTLLPAGIVEHVALTPRIALGAALIVAGSIAEIADVGGRRARAKAGQEGAAEPPVPEGPRGQEATR